MTRRAGPVVVVAAGLLAGIAGAQTLEPAGALPQITPPATGAARADGGQIGSPSRSVEAAGIASPVARAVRQPQITPPGDARAPAQVTPPGRSAQGPAQIAPARRDARPPAPLSTPAEGRTAAVARVEGRDRCDPAAPAARRARCATVIETRGGDFPPPSREPLSPEQRLLVEQRTLEANRRQPVTGTVTGDVIARDAMRRSARDGGDPAAAATQGIASVVLGQTPATPTPPAGDAPTAGLTPEQAVVATGVPGLIGATPP